MAPGAGKHRIEWERRHPHRVFILIGRGSHNAELRSKVSLFMTVKKRREGSENAKILWTFYDVDSPKERGREGGGS